MVETLILPVDKEVTLDAAPKAVYDGRSVVRSVGISLMEAM